MPGVCVWVSVSEAIRILYIERNFTTLIKLGLYLIKNVGRKSMGGMRLHVCKRYSVSASSSSVVSQYVDNVAGGSS